MDLPVREPPVTTTVALPGAKVEEAQRGREAEGGGSKGRRRPKAAEGGRRVESCENRSEKGSLLQMKMLDTWCNVCFPCVTHGLPSVLQPCLP